MTGSFPKVLKGCTCDHSPSDHDAFGCRLDPYSGCDCKGKMIKADDKPRVNLTNMEFELRGCTCPHQVKDHDETGCTAEGYIDPCRCQGKYLPVRKDRQAGFVPINEVVGAKAKEGGFGTASLGLKECTCKHPMEEHDAEIGGCNHFTTQGDSQVICPCLGYVVDEVTGEVFEPSRCCGCEHTTDIFSCGCDCHDPVEWDIACTCNPEHSPEHHSVNGCNTCNCRGVPKGKSEGTGKPAQVGMKLSYKCSLINCCSRPLGLYNHDKCPCKCHVFEGAALVEEHDNAAVAELKQGYEKSLTSKRSEAIRDGRVM